MTISIIIAIAAALALLSILVLFRSQIRRSANLDELRARLQPIDVKAFRNLIEPGQEQFLRERLPGAEFRAIHRERMLAAVEYVSCAAHNAGVLIQLAEAAKYDADPTIVDAALQLQETAFQVRLHAYRALPRFYVRILLPSVKNVPPSLVENCDRLGRQAVILGCLKVANRAIAAQ